MCNCTFYYSVYKMTNSTCCLQSTPFTSYIVSIKTEWINSVLIYPFSLFFFFFFVLALVLAWVVLTFNNIRFWLCELVAYVCSPLFFNSWFSNLAKFWVWVSEEKLYVPPWTNYLFLSSSFRDIPFLEAEASKLSKRAETHFLFDTAESSAWIFVIPALVKINKLATNNVNNFFIYFLLLFTKRIVQQIVKNVKKDNELMY